jgi:hypothetical protein
MSRQANLKNGAETRGRMPLTHMVRWMRWLQAIFQIIAAMGLIGFVLLGILEALPAWQQVRLWQDYRRADLVVHTLSITSKHSDWIGSGEVDGQAVEFRRRELEAVLGKPPPLRDEALALARQRMPLRATVLWNPKAWHRVLAQDTSRETVVAKARFALSFVGVCALIGAVAFAIERLLKRRIGAIAAKAQALEHEARREDKRQASQSRQRGPRPKR